MKEMLCFDIDGTLQDNVNHQVCASTWKALHLLKDAGYKIVLSSGRGFDSLKRTSLIEQFDFDGFVCNNGQDVYDKELNSLFHTSLSPQSIIQTLEIAKQHDFAVVLKARPRVISKEADEYVLESQRFFNNIIPEVGKYVGQEVDAMIVYGPKGYDYAPFYAVEGVEVLPGESTYADITIAGISKATGIQILLDMYHIKDFIAFGDSLNDMEMFRHAKYSIAMGQGNPKLKALASYVTSSIDEDGIYNACVYLKLINKEKEKYND